MRIQMLLTALALSLGSAAFAVGAAPPTDPTSTCYLTANGGVGLVSCLGPQGEVQPAQQVEIQTLGAENSAADFSMTVVGVNGPEEIYGEYKIATTAPLEISTTATDETISITSANNSLAGAQGIVVSPMTEGAQQTMYRGTVYPDNYGWGGYHHHHGYFHHHHHHHHHWWRHWWHHHGSTNPGGLHPPTGCARCPPEAIEP